MNRVARRVDNRESGLMSQRDAPPGAGEIPSAGAASAANGTPEGTLVFIGASHKTTPLQILESVAFGPDRVLTLLPEIRVRLGLDEVAVLSTCNRTEVYGVSTDPTRSLRAVEQWLLGLSQGPSSIRPENLIRFSGSDVAEHAFRVASGIDSMIVGETQIAGQAEDAFRLAREADTAGPQLRELFAAAHRAQRRVRSETGIGEGSVSMASAAVHLARRVFGKLDKRRILIVGAGDTAALAARHFEKQNPAAMYISNRTFARAEDLARELSAAAIPLDACTSLLGSVDVVLFATRSPEPLATKETVTDAVAPRGSRMLLLIDVSLPRNVDPRVSDIENVFLHDMYDLRQIVEQNLARRAKEIPAAEKILRNELRGFLRHRTAAQAGPLIRDLRERYETVRRAEVERFLRQFREEDRPVVERLTRNLVNKLLHRPMVEIKGLSRDEQTQLERLSWARSLFGLDGIDRNGDPEE